MPGWCSARFVLVLAAVSCAPALTSSFCAAQSPNQAASDAATYPIDGVVEDSLTHQPIARVLVSSVFDEMLTDNEGRFELHLPAGVTEINLRRPGYGSGGFMSTMTAAPHRVKVAADMAPLTLYLTPAGSVVAHVALSSGDEPDGVRFTLYRRQVFNGHARWVPVDNTVSNSQGDVHFPALGAPASYVFCSQASLDHTGPTAPGAAVYGYPGRCFPGGVDFASAVAAPLKLHPAQQAEFEVELDRQPFYPVTISAGPAQNPAASIQVHSLTGEPSGFAMYRNGPGGPTVVHLPNGSYYAEASERSASGPLSYARVDFIVAGGPAGFNLAPVPAQPLSVEIERDFTASSEQDARSASVSLGLPGNLPGDGGPDVNLSLLPLDTPTGSAMGGALRRDPSAPEGDLYLWDIAPAQGRFRVQANSFRYYVSSITSGDVDLARDPLVIGPGGSAQPIEIVLRNDTGQLVCSYAPPPSSTAGNASAAGEFNSVYVYAIPLFPSVEEFRQGIARLPGQPMSPISLPPGSYLVVGALDRQQFDQQQFDLDDPQTMARLTAAGQKVTIQAGETSTVALDKLIGGDEENGNSDGGSAEVNP